MKRKPTKLKHFVLHTLQRCEFGIEALRAVSASFLGEGKKGEGSNYCDDVIQAFQFRLIPKLKDGVLCVPFGEVLDAEGIVHFCVELYVCLRLIRW